MFEMINRGERKREAAELLRTVQVPARLMTALYLALLMLLNLIDSFADIGFLGTFISIMTGLLASVRPVLHGRPPGRAGGVPDAV